MGAGGADAYAFSSFPLNGNNGSATTFTYASIPVITAGGGIGTYSTVPILNGGTASGGDININGQVGQGRFTTDSQNTGGNGGNSPFGIGGIAQYYQGTAQLVNARGTGYGAGGGSLSVYSSSEASAGGSQGVIFIEY